MREPDAHEQPSDDGRREALLQEEVRAFNVGQREVRFIVPVLILVLSVPLLTVIPGAADVMGVGFWAVMGPMAAIAITALVTTWAYRRWGVDSRVFETLDVLETAVMEAGIAFVIVASGRSSHVFWIFYITHVLALSLRPRMRAVDVATVLGMPVVVTLWQYVAAGPGSAVFPALMVLLGATLLGYGSGFQRRITDLLLSRERLQREVSALRLENERRRIARDLHDGVTADLAAIAWRADALSRREPQNPLSAELSSLGRRARSAIDEARAVVWALRGEDTQWSNLMSQVAIRLSELCQGGPELELELQRDCDQPISCTLSVDVMRIAQEAVRNALQHADASHVWVRAQIGDEIFLCIRDDGKGLSAEAAAGDAGGIANIRARAAAHQGTLRIEAVTEGTQLSVFIPLKPGSQHDEPEGVRDAASG